MTARGDLLTAVANLLTGAARWVAPKEKSERGGAARNHLPREGRVPRSGSVYVAPMMMAPIHTMQ